MSFRDTSTDEYIELKALLVQVFFQHVTDLPFFLDKNRFVASIAGTGYDGALNALLATLYLWGVHLCSEGHRRQFESRFATKAQQAVSQGILGMQGGRSKGDSLLYLIQAEILMAQYLFRNWRHTEGRYHMIKALSLATGARLHAIRSAEHSSSDSVLPPPANAVEEGERIRAFWTVMNQNNSCTSVDGSAPSNLVYTNEPGLRIDTPWPEDMDTYARTGISPRLTGNCTVQRFLAGFDDGNHSCPALHAKATILFERAAQVGRKHWDNLLTNSSDTTKSSGEFLEVESTIYSLSQQIAFHVHHHVTTPPKYFAFVSIMLDSACIRLYQPFIAQQPQSQHMAVSSARNIVRSIDLLVSTHEQQGVVIDPIIGLVALAAFRVLVSEFRKLAASEATPAMAEIRKLFNGMSALSSSCPLMSTQAIEARQILTELGAP
ncbi:hypothetical protein V5O48_018560 [Marasmius crinis-equi]|uniref:Transcription factor domain-containing protein n=1 Tax=Marasmius crinis-equi TaxID=585013 RepID=A0ABR3EKW9_9AGAR